MKKHFLAVSIEDACDYFTTTDLNELIREMYEPDLDNGATFEDVTGWFYNNFVVFESDSEIKEASR